ncbi:APC family permease [Aestuariirhabdus sp. Z084]|uniref:APC family permease n=1 Tax=Aestuariirhabdus haliotis TaxID=2918751 RepID=UPI00201B42F2|nr:APC family permease [Aestuariirhabdus haliotis]MCL6417539.1 APC family permease [Aestuariirhabdus haliotis]MCL6421482.1 APC family permease [Aestuariirhabdus haliotis]
MSTEETGKMGLPSLTLFSVCAVLVIDGLTAAASIGPSAITWWIITLLAFVIPYIMISSELGTTYPGEGGIYDWVKRAFGNKWAVRTTWYYWINVALWMPAVYIMFAGMFAEMFFPGMGLWTQILICIALTALTVWICNMSVDAGVWVTNLGALFKVVVIVTLGVGGFIYAAKNGVANEFTLASMTPNFDSALGFLPVIIFNLLGFELIACMGKEIKNPVRDIPKSMMISAALVTGLYIFGTVGILLAMPVEDIGLVAGIIATLQTLFGDGAFGNFMVIFIGSLALATFIANMVTWTMGASRAAMEAAQEGELPEYVAKEHPVHKTPVGANNITGIVSAVVILCYGFLAGESDELFWSVFAFSSCIFLLPYLLMFPAFLKLRSADPDVERPYRVPGGAAVAKLITWVCTFFIAQAVFLFIFPEVFSGTIDWAYTIPVAAGVLITMGIGEYLLARALKRMKQLESEAGSAAAENA